MIETFAGLTHSGDAERVRVRETKRGLGGRWEFSSFFTGLGISVIFEKISSFGLVEWVYLESDDARVRADAGILFAFAAWGRPTRRGDFMSPRSGVATPPKMWKDTGGRPTTARPQGPGTRPEKRI